MLQHLSCEYLVQSSSLDGRVLTGIADVLSDFNPIRIWVPVLPHFTLLEYFSYEDSRTSETSYNHCNQCSDHKNDGNPPLFDDLLRHSRVTFFIDFASAKWSVQRLIRRKIGGFQVQCA